MRFSDSEGGESAATGQNRRTVLKTIGGTMVPVAIAGCGGDDGGSDGTDTTEAGGGPTETTSESMEAMTLESWTWSAHIAHMKSAAEAYNEQYSDSQIKPTEVPNNRLADKLTLSIRSRENVPAMSTVPEQFGKSLARKGGTISLEEQMVDNGLADQFFPVAKSRFLVDGEWLFMGQDLGPCALYYNASIFEEAGLPREPADVEEEIQTWEEYLQAAETITNNTDAEHMLAWADLPIQWPRILLDQAADGMFYDEEGNFNLTQKGNVAGFETLKKLRAYRAALSPWKSGGQFWGLYKEGKIATLPYAAWMRGFTKDQLSDQSGDWRIAALPKFDGEVTSSRASNLGGVPAIIPSALNDRQRKIAIQWGKVWHFSEAGFNAKLNAGVFPPNDIEEPSIAEETDDFFGGQQVSKKFIEIARQPMTSRIWPSKRTAELTREMFKVIIADDEPIEETLDEFNTRILESLPEADKQVG